ncbi:putative reverse transcriptase zinc-binding domain-containing protein [Helianthus annuus]|uniref:Reverse transcriptase zinc-binding domain-containing protein n=1 Tax=Helianthus annuus TaxID=4232 RepID=A0A9K3GYP0_HELAN|nr:uncharacterized protein LOC110887622 [Helianthus annuus]KAF5760003.1 putative reverse transcriptase zinc-binding domain-containing protein [Helianthus annuus]
MLTLRCWQNGGGDLKQRKKGLWRRVVWAIHHNSRAWNDIPVKVSVAGPWKNMYSIWQPFLVANIDLKSAFSVAVGDGKNTCFWLDSWVESIPLYLKFPELFNEEAVKDCLVQDRWSSSDLGLGSAGTRSELGPTAANQLQQLQLSLSNRVGYVGADCWKWRYDDSGVFNVADIKCILSSINRTRPINVFEWNNWVPKKVGIVAWRAEMEKLPTKCALASRNVPVLNQMCVLCGDYAETCDHIFVSCCFAQLIWQILAGWCRIPPIFAFGIKDLLTLHASSSGSRSKRKVIHAVILVAFWSIWKSRNDAIFRQVVPNVTRSIDEIKSLAYLWVKNRSKVVALTWEDWNRFNLDLTWEDWNRFNLDAML